MRKHALVIAAALFAVVSTTPIAGRGTSPAGHGRVHRAAGGHSQGASWTRALNVEHLDGTHSKLNTPDNEGCPTVSRDGRRLFFASNRPGGHGGLDIWVSYRSHRNDAWGEPVNVGAPINTAADEFCPSPMPDGQGFLYISTKPGGCGGADMYITREHRNGGWPVTVNLGCHVNSAAGEASPFIVQYTNGAELYFSSTRPGGFSAIDAGLASGDSDIYVSAVLPDGSLAPPALVAGVNTEHQDSRPNVRHDGLEMIFDSDRPGALGMNDLYAAVRGSVGAAWSQPVNLGADVNTTLNETRPSLSWDARTLYFGSTGWDTEGSGDIFVTTRTRR